MIFLRISDRTNEPREAVRSLPGASPSHSANRQNENRTPSRSVKVSGERVRAVSRSVRVK